MKIDNKNHTKSEIIEMENNEKSNIKFSITKKVEIDWDLIGQTWDRPYIPRPEVGRFSCGIIAGKTVANLETQGRGPKERVIVSGRVLYPKESFIQFLREHFNE
jgi:hypothetical protein